MFSAPKSRAKKHVSVAVLDLQALPFFEDLKAQAEEYGYSL